MNVTDRQTTDNRRTGDNI